jgi:hypothetical protein
MSHTATNPVTNLANHQTGAHLYFANRPVTFIGVAPGGYVEFIEGHHSIRATVNHDGFSYTQEEN